MANEIKFTTYELNKLRGLQQGYQQLQVFFGEVRVKQLELTARNNELENSFTELKKQESQLVKELNEKYGEGELNPETGIFTPVQNK